MSFLGYVVSAGQNGFTDINGLYQCNSCKCVEFITDCYEEYRTNMYTKEYLENEQKLTDRDNKINRILFIMFSILLFTLIFVICSTI